MFHQQLNGEDVEEESGENEESDEEEEEGEEGEEISSSRVTNVRPIPIQIADSSYISQKLTERGITFEDLVKNILFQEHDDAGEKYNSYEHRSSQIYGQFRAVISQHSRSRIV
jgi:hypothetical protein